MTDKEWRVDLHLVEQGDTTTVRAVLTTGGAGRFEAVGTARRNPGDEPAAAIGDEVAAGRALTRLGELLLDTAWVDIEERGPRPSSATP